MAYFENIVVGKPIVDPKELFAVDEKDWEDSEKDKTYFTEERNLANILKELGVVPSIGEVRRNKPAYVKHLDSLDFFEIKWGKKKMWVLVGE